MIEATLFVRKMRGGSQSLLMLGSDCSLWVVKFQNNPQHFRILANEMIATRLAQAIGLSVPECAVIDVPARLIEASPGMVYELPEHLKRSYMPGIHFGSRFAGSSMPGRVLDYLPNEQLDRVRNLREFAGVLALDKWLGNRDGRQVVFHRTSRESRYRASFIDHGFSFNAGEWSFADAPLRGIYHSNRVYAGVVGWRSFEPWLSCIERMEPNTVWQIAQSVPPEWYEGHSDDLCRLVERLLVRRWRVRDLILSFRHSDPAPFPYWYGRFALSALTPTSPSLVAVGSCQ